MGKTKLLKKWQNKKQVKPSRLDGDLPKGLALRFDKYLVQDHQHVVGLDMGIIFMYNMSILEASWGRGWCHRGRLRRRRRRRGLQRSGNFTMKSGLTWGSFLCIICLNRWVLGVRGGGDGDVFVRGVGVVGRRGLGPSPGGPAWPAGHFGI